MKNFTKRLLSGILALIMISGLLCTVASANVKSSEYLDAYRVVLTPGSNGAMTITVQVTGVGYMPELGAKAIYLYESTDRKNFHLIESYDCEDYPIMMGSGTVYYEDIVTFTGTPGYYYMATAYVYAGDGTGGDTRSVDSSIKLARA